MIIKVNHVTLYPDYETNYIYSIGSKMSTLIYTVFSAAGTASIVVNGNTENIETKFGVTFSQVLSGEDTLIYLSSQYFEVDLADQELQIILTFTRTDNKAYVFPKITAKYFDDNTSPFFKVKKLPDS